MLNFIRQTPYLLLAIGLSIFSLFLGLNSFQKKVEFDLLQTKYENLDSDYQVALKNEATLKSNQMLLVNQINEYESKVTSLELRYESTLSLFETQFAEIEKNAQSTATKKATIESIKADKTGELNAENCLDVNVPDDIHRLFSHTKTSRTSDNYQDRIQSNFITVMDVETGRNASIEKPEIPRLFNSKLRI